MEHQILPRSASISFTYDIPYVGTREYLNVPFLDFPSRAGHGFIIRTPVYYVNPYLLRPESLTIEFLQSWLFFGWLQHVLGAFATDAAGRGLYQHSDFVRTTFDAAVSKTSQPNPGDFDPIDSKPVEKTFITTARLVERLEQWRDLIKPKAAKLETEFENLYTSLRVLESFLRNIQPASPGSPDMLPVDHKLNILTTLELVGFYIKDACHGQSYAKPYTSPFLGWVQDEVERKMTTAGWCPYDARQLIQKSPLIQIILYLEKLDNIQGPLQGQRHRSCDSSTCRKDLLSIGSSHRRFGCICAEFCISETEQDEISMMLEQDNWPLLSLSKSGDVVSVRVIPRSGETRYTALSHVCADGLGNEEANALQQCQLSYIYGHLVASQTSPEDSSQVCLVWLDTLCVPKGERMRKKAIVLMKDTYKEAEKVLVLDAKLAASDHREMDMNEILARIICSTWAQRLWTLQEGFLAESLWIQFCGEAVNIDQMMRAQNETTQHVSKNALYSFLKGSYFGLRTKQARDIPDAQFSIRSLALTLPGRLTTHPEDEPICLSTLLDLSLEKLLSVPKGDRMLQFWQLLSERTGIPDYIIFNNCSTLSVDGFRWAPRSLMHDQVLKVTVTNHNQGVNVTRLGDGIHGLHTEFQGTQLSPLYDSKKLTTLTTPQYMRLDDDRWYLFDAPLAEILSLNDPQLAIIYSRTTSTSIVSSHALLVKVVRSEGNLKFVHRIRKLSAVPALLERSNPLAKILEAVFQYINSLGVEVEDPATFADAGNEIIKRDPSIHACSLAFWPHVQPAQNLTSLVQKHFNGMFVTMGKSLPDTQQWIIN